MTRIIMKMQEIMLKCPLCCDKIFNSKDALIVHLTTIKENISCPTCGLKFSSLKSLIEHLSTIYCSEDSKDNLKATKDNVSSDYLPISQNNCIDDVGYSSIEVTSLESLSHTCNDYNETESNEDPVESSISEDNTYELLQKSFKDISSEISDNMQLEQNIESDSNTNKDYIMMTNDTCQDEMTNGQNIVNSLLVNPKKKECPAVNTQLVKMEADPVISVAENDSEAKEEIYSCNTCGVTFTSVLEHIQEYHKDEDVVVEVNDISQGLDISVPIEYTIPEEDVQNNISETDVEEMKPEKESSESKNGSNEPKRVITETGFIVETTKNNDAEISLMKNKQIPSIQEEVVDKKGRVFTRRYVQIENNEEEPATNKKSPYHQVVIKEVILIDGGEKMKVYHCLACQIYVTELNDFKLHPCKTLKYVCPHCPVSYNNVKSLCAHMKVHKSSKAYVDPVTGTVSTVSDSIQMFPENTSKEKKNKDDIVLITMSDYSNVDKADAVFRCEMCNTYFPSNKSLKLHKKMHDPLRTKPIEPPVDNDSEESTMQEKYFCPKCEKLIPVSYKTIHENYHKNTENFNCVICNKKFASNSYLTMHMSVHNVDKSQAYVKKSDKVFPYSCLYCERQFARPHEKVKHERIHTGEKPHTCEICGKAFRVPYCLTLHMRTHTGARPYGCPHCGKRFKSHSVYNHHLLTHSDVRAYKCPFCPKAFKTSVQLAGHKNSHTKPFSCEQCNRPFASLYAVRAHTETHSRQNNFKFSCTMCGASYARSFALKDHMRQAHQQEIENTDTFVTSNLNENKDWRILQSSNATETVDKTESMEITSEVEA